MKGIAMLLQGAWKLRHGRDKEMSDVALIDIKSYGSDRILD